MKAPARRMTKIDKRSGFPSQNLAPGIGACFCCRTSWNVVDGHATEYGAWGKACFPLCEQCWSGKTVEQRLPFYRVLFSQWEWDFATMGLPMDSEWGAIEAAVLAGK